VEDRHLKLHETRDNFRKDHELRLECYKELTRSPQSQTIGDIVDSYADYLRPFLPYIPSGLISAQCLDKILSVTKDLPPELGTGPFGFECSLDDRPAADFSVALMASRGNHVALTRLGSTDIVTPPPNNSDWRRIHQFALSWVDASSLLSRTVEEAWLEFDVGLTRDAPGNTPSVFFRIGYESPQEYALRSRLSREYVRVAMEGLDILEGRQTSTATLSRLAEGFHILPAFARIEFLGAMISRSTETVRVLASGMSLEDTVRYLQRLGFRGSVGHLALIADMLKLTNHMWLAADIEATGVSPRIGFELYCNSTAQSANSSEWASLLEFLVEKGICADHKRYSLIAAADMSNREMDQLAWPDSLRKVSKILGPAGFDRLEFRIHHIKVIDRPGVPLEAKAYLCGSYK
jgi:hypothetical protein